MNRKPIKSSWVVVNGKVRREWGDLTDEDLDLIDEQAKRKAGNARRRNRARDDRWCKPGELQEIV